MKRHETFPIIIPTEREYITVAGAIGIVGGRVNFRNTLHNRTDTVGFLRLLKELRFGAPEW